VDGVVPDLLFLDNSAPSPHFFCSKYRVVGQPVSKVLVKDLLEQNKKNFFCNAEIIQIGLKR